MNKNTLSLKNEFTRPIKRRTKGFGIFLLFLSSFPAILSDNASGQEQRTALQQVARVRADLEVVREDQRKLYAMLQENKRLLDNLQKQLNDISRQMKQLESGTAVGAAARQDIEALRNAIRQEGRAREKAIETVVESLSREIAAASSRPGNRIPATASSSNQHWTGPVQGEYTVVRGDTLSAIAQAFGISTSRLREANNIHGDLIREGQVLVIPE